MARTRAQDKANGSDQATAAPKHTEYDAQPKSPARKRQRKEDKADKAGSKTTGASASKKAKTVDSGDATPDQEKQGQHGVDKAKLNAIFSEYGVLPLQDSGHVKVDQATPETILALVYMAMLTSARISHVLAYESVKCLLEAGYHDLQKLKQSTWEERTEVLTKGGYTRYREKTATALGELAEFVDKQYDGDLNNLLKRADSSPAKVRTLVQEIKGIGKVGADIFFDAAQGVWPSLAPFIDPRSMDTAKRCGLGSDVDSMWEAVGKDPIEMCKLSSALTMIRLDKREKDFK